MKRYVKKKVLYNPKNHSNNNNNNITPTTIDINNTNKLYRSDNDDQRKVNIGLRLCASTDKNLKIITTTTTSSKVTSKLQYLRNMMNTKLRPCVKKRKLADKKDLSFGGTTSSPKNKISYVDTTNGNNCNNKLSYSSSLRNTKFSKTPVKLESKHYSEENLNQSVCSLQNNGLNHTSPGYSSHYHPSQYDTINRDLSPTKLCNIQQTIDTDSTIPQDIIKAVQSTYNLSKDFVLTSEGLKKIVFSNKYNNPNYNNENQLACDSVNNSTTSSRPTSSQSLSNPNTQHIRQCSDSYCSSSTKQQLTLTSEDEGIFSSISGSNKKRRHSLQSQSNQLTHSTQLIGKYYSNDLSHINNYNQIPVVDDDNNIEFPYTYQTNMSSTFYNPNKSSILCYNQFPNDPLSDDNINDIIVRNNIRNIINTNSLISKPLVTNCPESFIRTNKCFGNVETWENMINTENVYTSRCYYIKKQKYVSAKTRTILFGWLAEVCDAFKMHRETYYLSTSYVDRYLSVVNDIRCNQLQLLGITALFVAAKLEEIYPPGIHRFVNVTDGATTIDQVITQELALVKVLRWQLNEMTAYSWLALFVLSYENHQLLQPYTFNRRTHPKTRGHEKRISNRGSWQARCFEFPTTAFKEIVNITKLLEIVILDAESLKYPNIVIAASVFFVTYNYEHVVLDFTGLNFSQIDNCVKWMDIYSGSVRHRRLSQSVANSSQLSSVSTSSQSSSNNSFVINATNDDNYNIQRHRDAIKYLESCQEKIKSDQHIPVTHNIIVDKCYR